MEVNRLAPEALRGKKLHEQYLYTIIIASLIMVNGIFNYVATNAVFFITALLAGAAALMLLFFKHYRRFFILDDAVSIGAFSWCVLVCASGLWAVDGASAFIALMGYSTAFFLFIGAKAFISAKPGGLTPVLRTVGYCGAVLSLISVEMASTGFIFRLINDTFANRLGLMSRAATYGGWVEGARMESIMGLPNIYATFAAVCFLLLMWVVCSAGDKRPTVVSVLSLTLCGTGFFLANSRGGILSLLPTAALLVLFMPKGERMTAALDAVLMILWCAFTSAVCGMLMGRMPFAVVPLICASAMLLYVVWPMKRDVYARITKMNVKALLAGGGILAAAALIFVIVGLNVQVDFALTPGADYLNRAVSLPEGEYTLYAETGEIPQGAWINVDVLSASMAQASYQSSDTLLDASWGPGEEMPLGFTVPEGAAVVRINASSEGGNVSLRTLHILNADGSIAARIPMRYVLLPETIMSRVQGIWADANILQRFMYWRDGLILFAQSPLYGHGAYSFDTLSPSVADAYYYSRHVHNHFIQVMEETGLLGLAAMLTACAGVLLALWKRRDGRKVNAIPFIAAAIGMTLIHSFTEASLQNQLNVQVFFLILGIASGVCVSAREKATVPMELSRVAIAAYLSLMVALLGGHMLMKNAVNDAALKGGSEMYKTYSLATVLDPYNANTYRSSALAIYAMTPDSGAKAIVERFAHDLARNDNNPRSCISVGLHYFRSGDMAAAASYFERSIVLRPSNPDAWNEVLAQYYRPMCTARAEEPETQAMLPEMFASVSRIGAMLEAYNTAAAIDVVPNDTMMECVRRAALVEAGMSVFDAAGAAAQ